MLGQDACSQTPYDSQRARVMLVRAETSLQSLLDSSLFSGRMNQADEQIGNTVQPLLAHHALAVPLVPSLRAGRAYSLAPSATSTCFVSFPSPFTEAAAK